MREKTKEELTKLAEILVSKYPVKQIKGTNEFLECALVEARRNKIEVDKQSIKRYEQWLEMKCMSLQSQIDYMAAQSKSLQENMRPSLQLDGGREECEDYDEDCECEDDCDCDDCEELNSWYNYVGDVIDDEAIIDRANEITKRILQKHFRPDGVDTFDELFNDDDFINIFNSNVVHKPVYTMFDEVDGKITIKRGSYSRDEFAGKSPEEINQIRGWSCMPGWANGILLNNTELGENRPGALTEDDKIVLGKIMRNQI